MIETDLVVKPDSLLLSGDKTFFTLQGEGQSLGKPAVFLRLHLCNLHCSWCDTKYTWDRSLPAFYDEPERWDFGKTVSEISKYPARRLVITGGEPMLHVKTLSKFLGVIPDWEVEIESNGTIPPSEEMITRRVQFNLSPKLANSGNEKTLRYRPKVLEQYNGLPNTTYKFVVTSPADLEEIDEIVKECGLNNDKIILMPEGVTLEDNQRHGQAVAELCKERGWRLVPRLQILLWGSKRRT